MTKKRDIRSMSADQLRKLLAKRVKSANRREQRLTLLEETIGEYHSIITNQYE